MIPDFIYRMRALLFLLAISLFITCTARADVLLSEDFESYTVGTWPSPAWVQDANAINDPSNNQIVNSPGGSGKSLKLFGQIGGCWAAITYRQFVPPSAFDLEFDVLNGAEGLSGCHPYRGDVGLRQGTHWWNPSRELIIFWNDGTIRVEGVNLGQYEVSRWYHVKISYRRAGNQLSRMYWLDGQSLGQVDTTIQDPAQEDSLDHFELAAQEGSAWFDNIKVQPPCPCGGQTIQGLTDCVQALDLKQDKMKELIHKLSEAQDKLDEARDQLTKGKTDEAFHKVAEAVHKLEEFIKKVDELQKQGLLDQATADELRACAKAVIAHTGLDQLVTVALVNPDYYRILKHGVKHYFPDAYYSIANGTVADHGSITNPDSWTGLGASPDYLTTVLTNAGYRVDVYSGTNFPVITRKDYQLVIVQDPMTEVGRQFDPTVESSEPDLLQSTTNRTFLSRLDSYFKSGGSVILVGDAVRLLENGANRLNYGKQIVAQNAVNTLSLSDSLVPSHWLFIRGQPFCGVDRSGSGTYSVQQGPLAPAGAVLSSLSLFDGNDIQAAEIWSDTVYYPTDSVSLLDARVQGSGQYVLDGSTCDPPVYQVSLDYDYPKFMGYTEVNKRRLFYIGSDSFFDFQYRNYEGTWHAGQYQEIKYQVGADGVNAILGLVHTALFGK